MTGKVRVLGSGSSTGVPMIGCRCPVCLSDRPRNKRSRSSLLVTRKLDGMQVLVDTAPDLRAQALSAGLTQVDWVLYTHMHADHTQGFDDLRAFYLTKREPIPCYLGAEQIAEFKSRFAYAFNESKYSGIVPQVELRPMAKKLNLAGLEVESLVLPHGAVTSFGFRFGSFAYVTDFKTFPEEMRSQWRGRVKTMVASGLRFKNHSSHSSIPETLALFADLGVERGILTHLCHEVDYYRDNKLLPEYVELAYDGFELDCDIS